jgi:hypothetical protein
MDEVEYAIIATALRQAYEDGRKDGIEEGKKMYSYYIAVFLI